MVVSLVKGANVNLSKEAPGLTKVRIGLGWDARTTSGAAFDLDASALAVGENGKVLSDQHFVFFGNTKSPEGAVFHHGDNLTGSGDGDDEQIDIDLTLLSGAAQKVVLPVTIYEADVRKQNFGGVRNCFIRVVDAATNKELAHYDLAEEYSTETAVIFGEIYRMNGDWKFRAVGQGFADGLRGIASDFGVNV